jgi:ParB-like chromosome segregation protein Spo0J
VCSCFGACDLQTRVDAITGIAEEFRIIPIDSIEANPYESFEEHERLGMITPRFSGMPIEVFDRHYEGDTYQLIDGHRRVMEAKRKGTKSIEAWIVLKPS